MKSLTLILSLCLPQLLFAQNAADSLLRAAAASTNDSARLANLAAAFRQEIFNDPSRALEIATDYRALADKNNLKGARAKGMNFLGMSHFSLSDFDAAVGFYAQAQQQAEAEGDSLYAAIVLNNLAACQEALKRPEEAIRYFEEALLRFQRLGDKGWAAKVSHNLAKQHLLRKDFEASRKNFQLAYATFLEMGDSTLAGLARNGIGNYFLETEKPAEAVAHYRAAQKLIDPRQDPTAFAICLENEANALLKMGNGRAAEPLLHKALALVRQHQSLEIEANVSKIFVELHRQRGDFKTALDWQDKFVRLSDSLLNKEKNAALVDAVKKYDLRRKEQELALKDLRLESAQRQRLALWAGIGFLSALSLLGLYLARLKQRSNRQLAEKNATISKALAEKDLLMREIHHRVKNNLQVISSLLKLQSQHLSDPKALDALNEGRNRVHSMALIHQNLYQEEHLTAIEARAYIIKLAETLFRSYNVRPAQVALSLDVDLIFLDVDTAVPLGLILNELISNALKHAFDGMENGRLDIFLKKTAPDQLLLRVRDNGRGLPAPELFAAETRSNSFGTRLIRMLSEKLEADIEAKNTPGADISLLVRQFKIA